MTPNILWIVTDDAPKQTLTAGRMAKVWSRLVEQGVRFTKAYVAVPLCGPSRVSFLTSMYPHNHGCHNNATWVPFHDQGLENDTVATRLQAAGYDTGYFGKYTNGIPERSPYIPPGWDRFVNVLSTADRIVNVHGDVQDVANPVDQVSSYHLRNWLNNRTAETPWFAIWAPTSPHSDYDATAYHPSAQHAHDFDGAQWRPPSFNENSMGDKPSWLQGRDFVVPADVDKAWEGKLEELQDVDDQAGQIFDVLNNIGAMPNTFIFFLSDNGHMLGEHRLWKKEVAYEESAGVPFVVRGPGITPAASACTEMVNSVDLMPTTLDIAGLDPDEGRVLDGRSMLGPLTTGDWSGWRERMLVEYTSPALGYAMLCEGAMRFIDHIHRDGGEWELYDLAADPYQMQSLNGSDPAPWRAKLGPFETASGTALRALES